MERDYFFIPDFKIIIKGKSNFVCKDRIRLLELINKEVLMKKGILIAGIILISSCAKEKCHPHFLALYPEEDSITVDEGSPLDFSASVTGCVGDEKFELKWLINGGERESGSSMKIFACQSLISETPVEVKVVAKELISGYEFSHTWKVRINDLPPKTPPQEVKDAINLIKGLNQTEANHFGFDAQYNPDTKTFYYPENSTTPRKIKAFQEAVKTLDDYLSQNYCDVNAHYASVFGKGVLILTTVEERYYNREMLSPEDLIKIVDEEVEPVLNHLLLVKQEADENFSFRIKDLWVVIFHDNPETSQNEAIKINFSGEYDLTDVYFATAGLQAGLGYFNIARAFNGTFDFALKVPDIGKFEVFALFASPQAQFVVEKEIIKEMEKDPSFLTLAGAGGEEGKSFLQTARSYFLKAIDDALKAIDLLMKEKDDQSDDVIRFWDCGPDGVCPGDVDERLDKTKSCDETSYTDYNLNGKCNRAHCSTPEANPDDCEKPDSGEGNGAFDYKEPVGTEMLYFHTDKKERYTFPLNDVVLRGLNELKRNLIGPDPFDFDAVLGVGKGTVKTLLTSLGIPYPEIRLYEFFDNPTSLRNLFPLYRKSTSTIIIESEEEPFEDTGIDKKRNSDEKPGQSWGSPASVCDDKNPSDPCHDNFDIDCDPVCNSNDGYDNDGDGKCSPDDCKVPDSPCAIQSAVKNVTCDDVTRYGSVSFNADNGVEGNFGFDFIDLNQNGEHDPGEPSEPFDDVGIKSGDKYFGGANNNKFDRMDIPHYWPKGSDVGGNHPGIELDPKNGTSQDKNGQLIDLYYAFFPDPTFSGVITFPDPVRNTEGETLNKNAVLFRFIYKTIEMMGKLAPSILSMAQ
jgi:hypothetical protein